MKLFSKKSTFLIGSLVGSIVGLLFAREKGSDFRRKLKSARSSQEKFESFFQEYLKFGKSAFKEVNENDTIQDVLKGGREILVELKKRVKEEGSKAAKFAEKKTVEVIKEAERQANEVKKTIPKKVVQAKRKIKKTVKKSVKKIIAKKKAARKTTRTPVTRFKKVSRKK